MYSIEDKFFYTLLIAMIAVMLVIIFFIVSMIQQFRHYRQVQDGYDQARIEALERERQVIAADLHDDIGPLLSATLFKLGEIDPVTAKEKDLLTEGRNHIDSIFSRIRDLSSMLVPHSIERKGPLFAIEEFAELYMRNQSPKVEVSPVNCPGLSAYRSLHLFRMLQEILHNAIRHSKATCLVISGEVQQDRLYIHTADNGIGFNTTAKEQYPGLGLQNLVTRARMIGAEMKTDSSPGAGTKYTIQLSLNEQ
jgi:two-component system, NarL family, sensor kinase